MIPGWHGGRHEDGEALALPLEGGHPPLGAEAHAGGDERPVELVDDALVVLNVLHPCNLHHIHIYTHKSVAPQKL